MTISEQDQLIGPLLRDVSRSFYLTLRVLPREIRSQISLAYLLARATDTIADTKALPREQRIDALRRFNGGATTVVMPGIAASASERKLLERLTEVRACLEAFSRDDCRRINDLLNVIVTGQISDLERFPGDTEEELVALEDDAELDDYTYLVAGCVGEFWTRMCQAHLKELEGWISGVMEELGVRFGKGLQLVNVLRDIPKDLRIGRCYLPVKDPRALLDPSNYDSIRPEYTKWLDHAVAHLEAGWEYTMQIPSSLWRLRLACIWPIWIGLKTIARLRMSNPLDPAHRVKISRAEVYGVMARSFVIVRNDAALNRVFQKLRHAASRR